MILADDIAIAGIVIAAGIGIWAASRRKKITATAALDKTYCISVNITAGRTPVGVTAVRAVLSIAPDKEPDDNAQTIDPVFHTTLDEKGLKLDSTTTEVVELTLYDPNKFPAAPPSRDRIWVRIDFAKKKKLVRPEVLPDSELIG